MFDRDLHARCSATRPGLARTGCHLLAEGFTAVVAVNSWRQHYGNPARESLPGWTIGLALPVLAAPFLPRLARRRGGARSRRAGGRLRALADATPAGRDRYVDFLRVVSIVTVVLGHWTIAAVGRSAGGLTAGNVLSTTPWLWLATWVLQVMPVFFFVGGFSNMVSWQALERRGGGYVEYLSGRMARLLRPVLAFAAVWLVLPLALGRLGLPGEQVELIGKVMGQPLWFLGVYLVVVALAPAMVRLHRRFRLWVPATLAATAAAVDALRLAGGLQEIGYLNLLVVWALVQQVGFFYADGTLTRLSRRALAGLAAAGLAGLVVLTGTGLYPPSMVGLPGDESNMSPPTVCIVALTVWQVALVMLARGRASAWLARRGPWTAVIAVGSMAMTLYLWHLTAMVALYGLVLAVDGPLPAPGSGWWWATRPLWLALLAAVLVPMALALSRFERPARRTRSTPRAPETPGGRLAVILGVVLVTLGLLGFVASGFTPLLDPDGSPLLVLRVDPLQNLVHLVVGAALVILPLMYALWWLDPFRIRRLPAELTPDCLQPLLQLRRNVRKETGQEVPPPTIDRSGEISSLDLPLEERRVELHRAVGMAARALQRHPFSRHSTDGKVGELLIAFTLYHHRPAPRLGRFDSEQDRRGARDDLSATRGGEPGEYGVLNLDVVWTAEFAANRWIPVRRMISAFHTPITCRAPECFGSACRACSACSRTSPAATSWVSALPAIMCMRMFCSLSFLTKPSP